MQSTDCVSVTVQSFTVSSVSVSDVPNMAAAAETCGQLTLSDRSVQSDTVSSVSVSVTVSAVPNMAAAAETCSQLTVYQ